MSFHDLKADFPALINIWWNGYVSLFIHSPPEDFSVQTFERKTPSTHLSDMSTLLDYIAESDKKFKL